MSLVSHIFFKIANTKDSELEACEYLDLFARKCGFSTETIDEKCGNLNIAIEKYLRENNYMDFSNTSNYIQYELENNPTNKIKVLQDRIDVLSKIVNDLCVKLEYFTYYDSSDYGTYSNGYEKTFRSQTGRG